MARPLLVVSVYLAPRGDAAAVAEVFLLFIRSYPFLCPFFILLFIPPANGQECRRNFRTCT